MGKPIEMKLGITLFAFALAKDTAEKPAVAGDDGKWTKCEEPAAVDNGKVRCKKDTSIVKCDDGFMLDGAGKSKCVKGDDDTFAFNKELGACVACPDEGCPEMEKPDKPSGGKPTGGKPDKPSGGKPTGGKPTGDKPTGGKPTGDKPTGDKPPVFGDDGKWTKCEEPAAVENGKVKCKKDQCMLKCGDGFIVNGSAKSKCIKNDDGTFAFNKELGTCDACPDEGCPEMGKPDKPSGDKPTGDKPDKPNGDKPTGGKPTGDKPTGEKPPAGECKDFATMLGDDSVFTVDCAANDAGKMSCDVSCPDGQNFMGKDGKTGASVVCKCKGSKCKWASAKSKKTVNGKVIKKMDVRINLQQFFISAINSIPQ